MSTDINPCRKQCYEPVSEALSERTGAGDYPARRINPARRGCVVTCFGTLSTSSTDVAPQLSLRNIHPFAVLSRSPVFDAVCSSEGVQANVIASAKPRVGLTDHSPATFSPNHVLALASFLCLQVWIRKPAIVSVPEAISHWHARGRLVERSCALWSNEGPPPQEKDNKHFSRFQYIKCLCTKRA